jgi:hypothetical protein
MGTYLRSQGPLSDRYFHPHILIQPITRLATCFHAGILLGLVIPEDGGDMSFRNVC